MIDRGKQVGYEIFLGRIVGDVREKEKTDSQLTDAEFESLVAVVFRDTVIHFMKESHLYREDIPIDFYRGVDRYDITAPEGYYIDAAIALKAGAVHVPLEYELTEDELYLISGLPDRDIDRAVYVDAALVGKVSTGPCKYDEDFVNRYYEVILNGMESRFYGMRGRSWWSERLYRLKDSEYRHLRNRAIRGGTMSSKAVKIKYKRLSQTMR